MPAPSLLGLLGALLVLSLELPVGFPVEIPADYVDLSFHDGGVQKAVSFALDQYNHLFSSTPNYFKMAEVQMAMAKLQMAQRDKYFLMLNLVETACTKKPGEKMKFIQNCRPLPGDPEKPLCFFAVALGTQPNEMVLTHMSCT